MENLSLIAPTWGAEYELLDSGGGNKLERYGEVVLCRPEPQALWNPSMDEKKWHELAHATFHKAKGSDEKGEWSIKPTTPEQWWVEYRSKLGFALKMRLGLTAFKHIGLFPEQAANWDYIYSAVRQHPVEHPQVLNLFAYTGGASLAAAAAGGWVTHLDSVRQTVSWSRENFEASFPSSTPEVRWVVEDALKFALREARRGRKYDAIILDPPSYGRGADGEKWVLTENINQLLTICRELLADGGFMVLNLYSMGLSALLATTLVGSIFGSGVSVQAGELFVNDKYNKKLPLGVFLRMQKK